MNLKSWSVVQKPFAHLAVVFVLLATFACATQKQEAKQDGLPKQTTNDSILRMPASVPTGLPSIADARQKDSLRPYFQKLLKKPFKTLSDDEREDVLAHMSQYFNFLGLSASDLKASRKAVKNIPSSTELPHAPGSTPVSPGDPESAEGDDDGDSTPSNQKAIVRLFKSSTQFLYCPDFRDWACLEKTPKLLPLAPFRVESKPGLGDPVLAGNKLDMDVFFTEAWDGSPPSGVVGQLAQRIEADASKSLSAAMYGIDDITGTMKPVYDAIVRHADSGKSNVRAVVDISGFERGPKPWIFDYITPMSTSGVEDSAWLFAKSTTNPAGMHSTFQYSGTPDFIRALNGGIKTQEQARVRMEWPASHIMHNKFLVLENDAGEKAVWSGTANLSNHCMGSEVNSNMSIYIRNSMVSQAFLDEFNLMYNFDPNLKIITKLVVPGPNQKQLAVGRFHVNKVPVSHRFFVFGDGTKLRVHFAPTDDAEHRVILPMLLSARAGDIIRVSMFGGTGYEIVRAFQYAAAQGADVRIVFDRKLGHGLTSWIRDAVLNVSMPNPYLNLVARGAGVSPGTIKVRVSTWEGKNHYKAGSLSRHQPDGSYRSEEFIVGSQNWSSGGNDFNDENLVSIQNIAKGIPAADRFNEEFDSRLWPASVEENKASSVSH